MSLRGQNATGGAAATAKCWGCLPRFESMPAENAIQADVSYHGLDHEEETIEVEPGTTFDDVLRVRDIHPETVLVFVDGDVVPEATEVPEGADVRVLRIISGGAPTWGRSPKRS